MIYCPKCGITSELVDGKEISNLSCPSCGVIWNKFLETMANDALWPSIVERDKHEIICPKCGYERYSSDSAILRTECPSCRASYAESLRPPQLDTKACGFCGEQILAVARKCKHCGSVLNGHARSTIQEVPHSREVAILAKRGKIVDAIKLYRAETGLGLLEAKNYVESLSGAVFTSSEVVRKQPVVGPVSVPAKRNRQPGMVVVAVILGIVFGVLLVSNMLNPAVKSNEARKLSPKESAVTYRNDSASGDCYAQGEKVAMVVMASVRELAAEDIMPSQVMESGCSKIANGSRQCESQCVRGFKSQVRDVLH